MTTKEPLNHTIEYDPSTSPPTWVFFENGAERARSASQVTCYAQAFGHMIAKYRHAVHSGGTP